MLLSVSWVSEKAPLFFFDLRLIKAEEGVTKVKRLQKMSNVKSKGSQRPKQGLAKKVLSPKTEEATKAGFLRPLCLLVQLHPDLSLCHPSPAPKPSDSAGLG